MSGAQHTPGPWTLSSDGLSILTADGICTIAEIVDYGDAAPVGQLAADAHAMVTSPDLVAALRPFVEDFTAAGVPMTVPDDRPWQQVDEFSGFTVGDFRRAAAALAKATGQ